MAFDEALKKDESDPELLAAKADILYRTGKWDDALKVAEAVLKAKKDHFLARWVRARIYRDKGDMANADTEMHGSSAPIRSGATTTTTSRTPTNC